MIDGETPILISNEIIKAIREKNADFIDAIQQKGIRYIRTLCDKNVGGESLQYQKSLYTN